MTLDEKIREARRKCDFSQEQLAEKMAAFRSAIAKRKTDKGLPEGVLIKEYSIPGKNHVVQSWLNLLDFR